MVLLTVSQSFWNGTVPLLAGMVSRRVFDRALGLEHKVLVLHKLPLTSKDKTSKLSSAAHTELQLSVSNGPASRVASRHVKKPDTFNLFPSSVRKPKTEGLDLYAYVFICVPVSGSS